MLVGCFVIFLLSCDGYRVVSAGHANGQTCHCFFFFLAVRRYRVDCARTWEWRADGFVCESA